MKLLIKYLKPAGGFILATLAIKMLATLIELIIPYILSHILDEVILVGRVGPILIWGGVMIACAAAALFGNMIANRMVYDRAFHRRYQYVEAQRNYTQAYSS